MSPRFVLGRENVPCIAEVVNRSLKADCTDFTDILFQEYHFRILWMGSYDEAVGFSHTDQLFGQENY